VNGAAASPARSLTAKYQTNFGFFSKAGQFCEGSDLERNKMKWKFSGRSKSWPVSRLLLVASATGNASCRNAVVFGRTKSRGHIADRPICGASRPAATGCAQCFCRSRQFVAVGMKWSGDKAGESGSGRRRNSAEAWREAKPVGDQRSVASGEDRASVRSEKPGWPYLDLVDKCWDVQSDVGDAFSWFKRREAAPTFIFAK